MKIASVEPQLHGPMIVGQSVRLSRAGLTIMDGLIDTVLVGGKLFDQAETGQDVQCMVMGLKPDLVQVDDVLTSSE